MSANESRGLGTPAIEEDAANVYGERTPASDEITDSMNCEKPFTDASRAKLERSGIPVERAAELGISPLYDLSDLPPDVPGRWYAAGA
ncbi:hypothetical protein ACQEV2_11850 [Streptomyces sp. CA-251387]|uniref:hypothetical protein n=1 Tax=Streptomyces sp. CA-251387 TaxID=3240064 RepID=UPI003D9149BA